MDSATSFAKSDSTPVSLPPICTPCNTSLNPLRGLAWDWFPGHAGRWRLGNHLSWSSDRLKLHWHALDVRVHWAWTWGTVASLTHSACRVAPPLTRSRDSRTLRTTSIRPGGHGSLTACRTWGVGPRCAIVRAWRAATAGRRRWTWLIGEHPWRWRAASTWWRTGLHRTR